MKHIELDIVLTDDLGIKAVVFNRNDTELPNDSKLLSMIGVALIRSVHLNRESMEIQDTLRELNIELPKEGSN